MKFKEIVDIKTGKLNANASDENGKYPFYTCADTPLKINTIIGDYECLLLVGNGANTGKVFYNNGPFNAYQRTYILKPYKNNEAKFIYWFLNSKSDYLLSRSVGSATNYIKLGDIENLDYPDTSKINMAKVALLFDKIQLVINSCEKKLEKLDMLVKSRFVEMFGDPIVNPLQWEIKPLLDIGNCKNGMNFHYDDSGVEIHCLGVGDFKDLSIISDTTTLPKISLNEIPSNEYLLQNDDIVFVRSNGNKELVGRSLAVYPDDVPTTFSGFCIRFRKTDSSVTVPYLLRVLKNDSIRKKMAGRGANIQNLNQQILSALEIPIPPVDLQQQFAAFVEQTDKSKLAVNQVLEKAETLKKALMQEYFG